jgi:transglutaminase-like putative cysteine protease
VGVELNAKAVSDAGHNIKKNNANNVKVIKADATEYMEETAAAGKTKFDVVILDPPREGTTPEFIKACGKLDPSRIVYVSCNPETLARDLKLFDEEGYSAVKACPVDMFSFTEHVETVALLSKLSEAKHHIEVKEDINEYLKCDEVIDFDNTDVSKLADQLYSESESETEFVKMAYEYVRDMISHSADISADTVTCSASEVLKAGHGICFAKSHLLAAILRSKSVPAGFCYQKLILDDETAPVLIYHGLNGVYLREYGKWIRLDARGNKPGVNAQFSIDSEMLAFPIRPEKGEVDVPVIYADPDTEIVKTLQSYGLRSELWDNLPMKLGYEKGESN